MGMRIALVGPELEENLSLRYIRTRNWDRHGLHPLVMQVDYENTRWFV